MSSELTQEEKGRFAKWLGYKGVEMTKLFSCSTHDGAKASKFRAECDNKGQCVVVFFGSSGNVYGFYTAVGFNKTNIHHRDDRFFLFLLRENGKVKIEKFSDKCLVYQHSSYGPYISNIESKVALDAFNGESEQASTYTLGTVNLDVFSLGSYTSDQITGGSLTVSDIAVFSVQPKQGMQLS